MAVEPTVYKHHLLSVPLPSEEAVVGGEFGSVWRPTRMV